MPGNRLLQGPLHQFSTWHMKWEFIKSKTPAAYQLLTSEHTALFFFLFNQKKAGVIQLLLMFLLTFSSLPPVLSDQDWHLYPHKLHNQVLAAPHPDLPQDSTHTPAPHLDSGWPSGTSGQGLGVDPRHPLVTLLCP